VSPLVPQHAPPETRQLRFALVGSSGFAARMVAPALLRSRSKLVGLLGSSPERAAGLATRLGVETYPSLVELLADPDVDAVWVASKDVLHEPIGLACLEAGKHVLMEKPMASSAAGARTLIAAAQRTGVVLRVGCHQRFRPVYRDLGDLIAEGSLGRIGFIRMQFLWEFPRDRVLGNWRATLEDSGGSWVIKEFGAHLLDLLLWWTGPGAQLAGAVLTTRRFPVETDDCAAVLLRLADGGIATVEVSTGMRGRTNSVEIQGTEGWIRAFDVWRGNGRVARSAGADWTYHNDDELLPYIAQLDDFTAAVAGRESTGADGRAGLAVLELVEAAIATGRA
jgi:predicted dehydrogenase